MKLGFVLFACSTANKTWMTKEWEVINAYDADEAIVLKDPKIRSNLQWHDCGEKPPTPVGARDVRCNGTTCATVCKKGYRSKGSWKSRCQANKTWTRKTLSECITCEEPAEVHSSVTVQNVYRRNLPVRQYFCGDNTDTLSFNGETYNKGGNKKNVKCLCKVPQGQKWGKKCQWYYQNNQFADFENISCASTQPQNNENQ